jgi:membrane protease YdiL (CAAX protease family)
MSGVEASSKLEIDSFSPARLVLVAFLCEGLLFLCYYVSTFYLDLVSLPSLPRFSDFIIGIAFAIALFIINFFLIRTAYKKKWTCLTDFIDELVTPLVSNLTLIHGLLISIAAGVGEEFFFRALLQPYIGIVYSSILFSLAHFMFELKRFYILSILYFFIGVLFGVIYEYTHSIWIPLVFHVVYDFIAIVYFRYFFDKRDFI